MYIRSILSVLIVTSSFILAFGQDAPKAEKEKESAKAARTFAFSFDGDGAYLGVQTQEVNKENFSKFGLREVRGVAVEKVMENSPAAAAGLQTGDVIVRFNRDEVTSTRKLTRLISEVAPDHQVSLTVLRNGNEKEIKATLGKRQMPQFENGNFSFAYPEIDKLKLEKELKNMPDLKNLEELKELQKGDGPMVLRMPKGGEGKNFIWRTGERRQIGISVYPVTKQLGERYGVDGGVMINDVRDDSPAAKAGLKAGDIIVEAEGKAVKNQLDLIRSISDKKEGDVQLTIVRDRNRQTISVTPEAAKDGGFVFQTGDDDEGLFVPVQPGELRPGVPSTPVAPMAAPGLMMRPVTPGAFTVPMPAMPFIPGRVI
jgi:membrane-associated protease RseP (regulator of RpoE activity)